VIRAALAVASVAAIAWLAILFRDSLLIDHVTKLANDASATPAQLAHGLAQAKQARLLNPDRSVPLSWEAEMHLRQNDQLAGVRTYQRLVAAEPQFADAWFLIAARAQSFDPALAARARAALKRLDPLYPR
jgi:hypothetical protein